MSTFLTLGYFCSLAGSNVFVTRFSILVLGSQRQGPITFRTCLYFCFPRVGRIYVHGPIFGLLSLSYSNFFFSWRTPVVCRPGFDVPVEE